MTTSTLMLESGTLWAKVQRSTAHALGCGALQSLPTQSELVEQAGVRFLVRILANLAHKEKAKKEQEDKASVSKETFNPFLPYDENLFVADISDTHVCLLNKFNVVDHHLLIVTRAFEDQESLLTLQDFEALWVCMLELDGLAFYNAGRIAGASQHHKHLQLVPLPLVSSGPRIPMESLFPSTRYRGAMGTVPGLPFAHAIARLEGSWMTSFREAADTLRQHYLAMLHTVGLQDDAMDSGNGRAGPYNLLATRQWMLLVPRSRECFESISVNALGFAGALLVRNEEQLRILKKHGPMTVLRSVARNGSSGPSEPAQDGAGVDDGIRIR